MVLNSVTGSGNLNKSPLGLKGKLYLRGLALMYLNVLFILVLYIFLSRTAILNHRFGSYSTQSTISFIWLDLHRGAKSVSNNTQIKALERGGITTLAVVNGD